MNMMKVFAVVSAATSVLVFVIANENTSMDNKTKLYFAYLSMMTYGFALAVLAN